MSSLSGSVSTFVIKTSSDPTIWFEQLNRIFNDLRHRNEDVRQRAAKFLKLYVTAQVRELSADHFTKFLLDLNARISSFVNNSVIYEKAGAVLAIDELIDIDYDQNENADKILKFGNYLRIALSTPDNSVLFTAARALGRLVRAAGTLTEFSDSVDTELKRALEWLKQAERYEPRRYAAVLILKEMAINAPTLFNVHINGFIESVYIALTDSNVLIRDTAVEALRACLDVIIEKERHLRVKWYSKLWNEAQQGFKQKETHPAVHAGLLVLGELLVNTGDFMEEKYKETCEVIFRYKESQQKPVRKTVIALLPRLAAYSPTAFCKEHLHTSIQFLLTTLKKDVEKGRCFLSLGEIALATSIVQFKPHLDAIIPVIKSSFQVKKRADFCPEVLQCAAMLAAAIGPQLKPHMEDLLQDMFNGGLSEALTQTLKTLGQHIPAIMGEIQELLLNYLAVTLGHRPFSGPASTQRTKRTLSVASFHDIQQSMSSSSSKQVVEDDIALALRTLGSFDFAANTNVKNFDAFLIELVRDCVVHYLDNYDPIIRKESALTSARLVGDALTRNTHAHQVVADVLEKLLIVGITEQDYSIRRGILESLDTRYDNLLAEAENLRSLFLALNDEIFEVRELAITIIGRLTIRNPAYVMPSLRKTLVQLLGDLQFSGDSRRKEASTRLLAHLIKASHRHIKPYVDTIIQVLLPKLTEENAHVASYVLSTLGELSLVGGEYMKQYLPTLVPRIIDTLQDQSSANKREGALRTLCKLSSFTGYVITPYFDYPQLFDILLNEIRTESNAMVRVEVMKTLGVLGGLDPSKYPIKGSSKALVGRKQKQFDDVQTPTVALSSTEGYYHTVAINALVKIMRDPSLSTHYKNSIDVLVNNIMEGLGIKGAQFLPQIMPPFFQIMRNADLNFLETLFTALSKLVTIVKHHIRDYLDDMFELIRSNWSTPLLTQIIFLVEVICKELNDEFKVFLPHLIPPMLKVLHFDTSQRRLATRKVLRALETFGANLEDYLHLVIPAIMNLFEQEDADAEITKLALQTLSRLSHHLNFADYASRIIHPIVRLLAVPLPDPKQKEQYSMALDLRKGALDTLCELVHHLGSDYVIFISMVNKVLSKQNISDTRYDTLISRLIRNQPLVEEGENFNQSPDPGARLSRSNSLAEDLPAAQSPMIATSVAKWKTNQEELKTYWETGQRTTREDWAEWIRRFSVALLRESPSLALRSCNSLAQDYYPLVRELFNAGFISCWSELDEVHQADLVNNLRKALDPNIPAEILQTLLNLAEFMEHEDKRLPIPAKKLSVLAEACSAYAKALYYKEEEFQTNPAETIESLISLNNQLGLPQAADGILIYAEKYHGVQLQESWFEKLNRWDEALESYRKRDTTADTIQGQIRCLHALGEWEDLGKLSNSVWETLTDDHRKLIAPFCAAAAWNTSSWDTIEKFVGGMDQRNLTEKTFYQAVIAIHSGQFPLAQGLVDKTRRLLDTELTALMRESYNRSYKLVIFAQQLSELEEVVDYKLNHEYTERRDMIRKVWSERLKGVQRYVDIWTRLLAVRNLVLSPIEDMEMRLKFASICRKNNRVNLAAKTLTKMLGMEPALGQPVPMDFPRVSFAYLKHLWETGSVSPNSGSSNLRQEAFDRLKEFAPMVKQDSELQARAYQKLGLWQQQLQPPDEKMWSEIINYFNVAVEHDPNWYNGWHSWALANFEVVSYYEKHSTMDKIPSHLICSIKGFFRSISLSPQQALQDTLRLLTLWFKYGHLKEVESVLLEGFGQLSIDTWLQVIPQIIARIAAPVASVRRLVNELLINVGKEHPQALVFPLNVALKSQAPHRIAAAKAVIEHMRKNHNVLVDQALMVSQELVRVAILWSEMWHEGLEEASKHHFAEHNTQQAIEKLRPLHAMLEKGPETMAEEAFLQSDGRDLMEALEWTKRFERSGQANDFDQAWDLYYNVFKHAKQFVNNLTTLQMEYCSPKLLKARDLQLAVPGTYRPGKEVVEISSFVPTLDIIPSKQHPRKLAMSGSDGIMYRFLLKGHDDMRQDERVMQLFGLVNTLLANQFQTSRSHLKIQRYAVVPLAPNSGLVGWVPNCDTLLVLIREYRDARKIHVTHEHRLLLQMSPDYANLATIQKLEIFKYALDSTDGKDLKNIIWRQSRTAEVWLERRTHYTRSLAVMSMVGYVLGLGDRHCSNLMLDRKSGKIVHIDFGDCFEVAMLRDKLPERIPFRLTRMLTTAMGVSGYEGTFRNTCENVMRVLRDNKESLMAVLEAFVHDPLIGWRLLTPNDKGKDEEVSDKVAEKPLSIEEDMPTTSKSLAKSLADTEAENTMPEVMNEKAIQIINRISNKLTGKDFSKDVLSVNEQVDRLIKQATDIENLCQCYLGWSPYW